MRHIVRFLSRTAMFLLLAAAFFAVGCAAEDDTATQAEHTATLDTRDSVELEAASRVCPRDPGVPVPGNKEEQFNQCVISCQAGGHPYSACWATCCRTYTGCQQCYV